MNATAVIAGVGCVWLGMVLGVSFLEAPLKFRAPGVTTRIGLGIGRVVFRALNAVEVVLALVLVVAGIAAGAGAVSYAAWAAVLVLLAQLVAVRPVLNRRSDRILAGEDLPRSSTHLVYIGAEVLKVAALVTTAVLALS